MARRRTAPGRRHRTRHQLASRARRGERSEPEELGRSNAFGLATANASGVAVVTFGPPRLGISWEVARITIRTTSAADGDCTVYDSIVDDLHIVDYSDRGNADVSDEANPVPVSNTLILRWTGQDVGAKCSARIDYNVIDGRG